jgi:hypothetical protein
MQLPRWHASISIDSLQRQTPPLLTDPSFKTSAEGAADLIDQLSPDAQHQTY